MPIIHTTSGMNLGFLPVSSVFMTEYLPKANATYVKVYLYTYHLCLNDPSQLSTEYIASSLALLESDVLQALRYWMEEKLLILKNDEDKLYIEFLTPESKTKSAEPIKEEGKETKESVKAPSINPVQDVLRVEKRPDYTPEEINVYSQAPEIKQMFLIAQQYLGKTLSPMDLNILFSFYDWLRLPTDVIETLIEYCVSNNHRNMRYIEKVAINWVDQGIDTIEKAHQQIAVFNKHYRVIMKAFGLSKREPTPKEMEYMKKWTEEFGLHTDIIVEACNRTIMKTSNPSFSYADSIITSWYNSNVRIMADIDALDADFAKQRESKLKPVQNPSGSSKQNQTQSKMASPRSFINFPQRSDWDFDELARLEREYQEKKLLEG